MRQIPYRIRCSHKVGRAPQEMMPREIAINHADDLLYFGRADGSIGVMPLAQMPDELADVFRRDINIVLRS